MTLATLPTPVRALYMRLTPKLRSKVEARVAAMQALAAAPRSQWEATAERLSAQLAPRHGRGFSKKSLLNLWRAYRERGPESLLVNYGQSAEKPAEFVEELTRRVENNKRVASVEIDAIRADWLAGVAIPGYGTWRDLWAQKHAGEPLPDSCPHWFFPKGFSPDNLRNLLPGRAHLTLARKGFFAAHSVLPQKRNDYRDLRPLEMVVFDDVRCDWLVAYPGVKQACELWLLVAMDVATRCVLDFVSLAAVPDDEGKRAELLESHMTILAGGIIRRYGVPSGYPMTLKVENAKATLRESARTFLDRLSGGQIRVEYTRMVNRALASGYGERHGTPWDIKGVLESFFRTFHDHTAQIAGHTGARYDLAPAELKERKADHLALMQECDDLPSAIVDRLRLSFLRYSEAVEVIERVFEHLNARTRHNLSGFEKIEVFRLPTDTAWRPLEELRRYPTSIVRQAVFERRMESPRERFDRLFRAQPPFTIVPEEALLPLLARTVKRVRHPAPYTISWKDDGVEWLYRGELPELASGKGGPFSVKILPDNVAVAWLHDEQDRLLGALHRVHAPKIGDQEAQLAAVGEVQHVRSLITQPVMERHAQERAAKDENERLNAAVIAAARTGRTMTEQAEAATATATRESRAQQKQNADRARQMAARAQDLLKATSETP